MNDSDNIHWIDLFAIQGTLEYFLLPEFGWCLELLSLLNIYR